MIGTVLKYRYEVLEKIGQGNLFTVYKCDDKIDNRPVVVKVLLPQYAENRMFAERLLVEAQAMTGISHPGIVEVYDSGEEGGNYFVVVEYVRGVDLSERIRRNAPFSLSTTVDVGLAFCDVLDFAHRRGFVHGDLRPGNILVTSEGHIKVADFWVSAAIASASSIRVTAMMRSIHYMAPEVAEGQTPTPAADIYSLGIILFELLTGTVPFDGDTPVAIALKHAREPVPALRPLNPGVPKNLEAILVKALQKSPENRFRSAKAMLNELKSVHDALNLARPLVWSRSDEKTIAEPADVELTADGSDDTEPAVLTALRKTLIVVVGLVTVLVAALMLWMVRGPENVRVPDLRGKTLDEARSEVADEGLMLSVRAEEYNDKYAAGTIYYMNPSHGRIIKSGKAIDVWLSKGSRFVFVPKVTGQSIERAKERLSHVGLNVGEISEEYSSLVAAGNIVKQTPAPGVRVERTQPINLVYSLGPEPEEISLPSESDVVDAEQIRTFDVKFKVPEGYEDAKVHIVVEDAYGESTVYSDIHQPGDVVKETVEGVGRNIVIRIYMNDRLVNEERK